MKAIILILAGISAITFLEFTALSKGINGTMLSLSFAAIGGIVGFGFKKAKEFLNAFVKKD